MLNAITCLVVPDGAHQDHLAAFQVRYAERVAHRRGNVRHFGHVVRLPGQPELRGQLALAHLPGLVLRPAGDGGKQQDREQEGSGFVPHCPPQLHSRLKYHIASSSTKKKR